IIDENTIIIDAKTGVSGAGKGVSQATHFAETNDNLKVYKLNQHQHTDEIEQDLNRWNRAVGAVTITTKLVQMTRGIMATMYATLKKQANADELHQLFLTYYEDNYYVWIRDLGKFPSAKEVSGSNFCDIGIAYDERINRVTIVSVID